MYELPELRKIESKAKIESQIVGTNPSWKRAYERLSDAASAIIGMIARSSESKELHEVIDKRWYCEPKDKVIKQARVEVNENEYKDIKFEELTTWQQEVVQNLYKAIMTKPHFAGKTFLFNWLRANLGDEIEGNEILGKEITQVTKAPEKRSPYAQENLNANASYDILDSKLVVESEVERANREVSEFVDMNKRINAGLKEEGMD